MAKQESLSFTQKLAGNQKIVLGIVILMLILFTVDLYVVPAFGGGGSQGKEYVRFTAGGKTVSITAEKFQADFGDWQRFQPGQSLLSRQPRAGTMEEFLGDTMTAGLARAAGLSIPDATVRDFISNHPLFQDRTGDFDPAAYTESLKRFYGGLSEKAFEKEARRYLLVDHYRKIYTYSFLEVTDAECYQRWKGAHPKVEITYSWQPVAPIREGLTESDLAAGELDTYWKDTAVQNRHRTPDRRTFQAVAVRVDEVDDAAYEKAREERKDDRDLAVEKTEAFTFWSTWRQYDFNIGNLDEAAIQRLRERNEPRYRREEEEAKKAAEERKKNGEADPPAPPKDGEAVEIPPGELGPVVDPYTLEPTELDPLQQYDLYWRHRIEKELWLQKVMEKVRAEMAAAGASGEAALETLKLSGLGIRVFDQAEPVDQYQVEKIEGLGGPNCPLRYSLNEYKADRKGTVHPEVLQRTATTPLLAERGWVVFRFTGIDPSVIPSLDAVRAEVVKELLDRKAREESRSRLAKLRKTAEEGRSALKDAAAAAGFESDAAGPFNEFSWRPPYARDALKDEASRAAAWKNPDMRVSAVMSRYFAFREVPVGAFSEVIDDVEGTGAMYLVQVNGRKEPAFEEMTPAQIAAERRAVRSARLGDLEREMSYDGLRDKVSLFIDDKPAPPAEEIRQGR